MRPAAAILLALLTTSARAAEGEAVERLALIAGASSGGPGRAALRYAASDAREVARVLGQLGGIDPSDLVLIEEPDVAVFRSAVARLGRRAAEIRTAGRRPELFVYYSGHSDEEGLLLGGTRLSYGQLREDLDAVPVEVRVAILDSCASGAFTRAKGGQMRPAFQVDTANRVRGHAFLTSSAADEASQESDRLRASFFTHSLLTGLRGAADTTGDGVVTLNEAYQFAFRETLARTEATRSGPQHATYDIALVGSGDVVMTDLRRAGAVLVLPDALGGKVFVRSSAGQLVAELQKVPGAAVDLAVDPGDYRVRVSRDGRLQEVQLALASGQRSTLPEARLAPVRLEATAARGPGAAAEDGIDVSPRPAPEPGPADRNVAVLSLGAVALRGDHGTANGTEVSSSATAGMLLELGYRRWFTDRLAVEGSFHFRGLEGEATRQGDTTTSRGSLVMGLMAGARYTIPLSSRRGLSLGVGGAAGAYMGVAGTTVTTTGSSEKKESGSAEYVPGGRVRLSLDYFPTRRLLLGLDAGYSQIGRFHRFIGGRRDYSGFEAALTVGFGWGR